MKHTTTAGLTLLALAFALPTLPILATTACAEGLSAPALPQEADAEQVFRDAATAIGRPPYSPGGIAKARAAADALDAAIAASASDNAKLMRLLAARVQTAVWLADSAALDRSFERLLAVTTAPEPVALAWANELNAEARFEKGLEVLASQEFTTDARRIDAHIARGNALLGLNRFEDAQAQYNTAPGKGRTTDQLQAIALGTRRVMFGRTLFNKELSAIFKDQQRGDLPVVELTTTKGPVLIELFEDQAPNTVGNFIEHVESGTYNGTRFHRFMRGFGIQGGDPETALGGAGGTSNGGWVIPDEQSRPDRRPPAIGRLVAAKLPANDSPIKPLLNSAGCQFTILTGPAESLDGYYTVFGRVIDGLERVRELREDDQIVMATVVSKREHEYKGVRLGKSAGSGGNGEYTMPRPGLPLSPIQTGEP